MAEPSEFGKRLKAFRLRHCLSQERLASKAGIPRQSILMVENGQRKYLSLPAAIKVADALGISLDRLTRSDIVEGT